MHGSRKIDTRICPPAGRLEIRGAAPLVHMRDASRLHALRRQRQWRERQRQANPVRYYRVPLTDSDVHKIEAGLRVDRAGDRPVDPATWQRLIEASIAAIVKAAIK
jgi:hypothetical protein